MTLQGSSAKAKLQGNQSAEELEVQPVEGKGRELEVSTWHLIYMSYTKAIYANSHCVACMSSPTLLTLQGLSAKVKLHDRKSAKDGHQVEGNEKRVEVSTWLSSLSVVHEGHIWKHTLRVMHDFTNFLDFCRARPVKQSSKSPRTLHQWKAKKKDLKWVPDYLISLAVVYEGHIWEM